MAVCVPKEYKSLVELVKNNGPGRYMTAQERRSSYWRNTLCVKVPVSNGNHQGSGVLITQDGYFLTNYHVLNKEKYDHATRPIKVKLAALTDTSFSFELEGIYAQSKTYDLTLAKIKGFTKQEPTEIVFPERKVDWRENIRIYGYKHECMEELRAFVATIGFHKNKTNAETFEFSGLNINMQFDSKIDEHSFTSSAEVENGWSGGPVVREETGEFIGLTYASIEKKLTSQEKLYQNLLRETNMEEYISKASHIFVSSDKVIEMIKHLLLAKKIN